MSCVFEIELGRSLILCLFWPLTVIYILIMLFRIYCCLLARNNPQRLIERFKEFFGELV